MLCASVLGAAQAAGSADTADSLLREGAQDMQQGNVALAIEAFERASSLAATDDKRALVDGELGAAYTSAGRYGAAQQVLKRAYDAGGPGKAARALDLGNLAVEVHRPREARAFYEEAVDLAGADGVVASSARLNIARLAPAENRVALLRAAIGAIDTDPARPSVALVRLLVNAGHQSWKVGPEGHSLAQFALAAALTDARRLAMPRLQGEALAEMALLQEAAGEDVEALETARSAAALVYVLPARDVTDLKISLEYLQGRLLKGAGNASAALSSYGQAVSAIQSILGQMPIEDEDGHSTYLATIDPVTRDYVGLLLDQVVLADDEKKEQSFLQRAVAAEESMHQAEMQDFLGDRCSLVSESDDAGGSLIGKDTAVIYPLVLDDRVELLMRTASGITHRRVPVPGKDVVAAAQRFSGKLRGGEFGFVTEGKKLYAWLVEPLKSELAHEQIRTLVFAPDASLHVVPFAALWDGGHYVIENYAVSNITGLSMTALRSSHKASTRSLIAGMAEPGPVVAKLDAATAQGIASGRAAPASGEAIETAARERDSGASALGALAGEMAESAGNRGVSEADRGVGDQDRKAGDIDRLKSSLALPGVTAEVKALKDILPGQQMVDSAFTLQNFSDSASSGDFGVVHIASHGFFGGNADSSFLLAYDDLLSMKRLQSLLSSEKVRERPIDLLTLSACETAEGNARAPLGIAGAGIKARARSVVGTLWPVDDEAARVFMERFYKGVIEQNLSKTEAMRQAQLALLKNAETSHPAYWGPFTLIGNWQ